MIFADNVNKSYRNGITVTSVLKDVSLTVGRGQFAVILGASGSGKSTLLSVLSGLEQADSGSVRVSGETLTDMNEKQRTDFRKRKIGFVFQQYFLIPHLTVEGNVRIGAHLAGNRNYAEIIEAVGLGSKKNSRPAELSGGEQQRVSIARALAKQPNILFLDEPTGALDEETGRGILDYLFKLQSELSFTAVMVTHNASIAETADLVFSMNSGKIANVRKNEIRKSAYEIGW